MVPLQQPQGSGAGKSKKKVKKNAVSDGSRLSGDKGGANLQISLVGGPGPILDPKFKNVTCYNCAELGHYVGLCTRIKRCFICSKTGHHMDNCLMWYSLLPTAQYWGSANPGLGFFHVEVEGPEAVQWLNMDNVGVVVIKEGEISAGELEKCFIDMWKANWFWQIRQIGPKRFLVRFPPSKRIKDLVEYPSINLKKDGVVIYFENWEGEAEPFEEFQEIWIKIYGIFRSFYEEARVKVAVRDKTKIPTNKLFEMEQCFYLVNFVVESEGEAIDVDEDDDEDPGLGNKGDTVNDDEEIGDDFKSLDKDKKNGANNKMETESSMPLGGRNELHSAVHQKLEVSVQEKVLGKEPIVHVSNALVLRGAEENIGKNLLQHFDDESDDEVDVDIQKEDNVLNNPAPVMPSMAWKEKKTWGPVQATRMSSRITRDGKSAIEKAQDLKKAKNLEIPKGNKIHGFSNSFAALDNSTLYDTAKTAGISLGHKSLNVDSVINEIKIVETNRLIDFHNSNPESFLPNDISLSVEEMRVGFDEEDKFVSDQEDHISDVPDEDEPWTLVHTNQRRRKKQICQLQGNEGMVDDNKDDFWDPDDMVSRNHNEMLEAPFSEKEVKEAIFGSYAEGFVETLAKQLCSVEDSTERRGKRRADMYDEQVGRDSQITTDDIVAGSWVIPQKKARTTLEVCDRNNSRGFGPMLMTAEDLARTLEANDLVLVGDGACFQVMGRQ
ncbi:hypothetical protein QYE76_033671 [Lolium multiflorum]|uniref:CCHC-type domain-containing protein n=1 Tax=Lolium multiflorum TaxID=4521 RepID=A0AAD8VKH9_LOLMU|nr:hypothetical protein QYE76_033667 [Lolium multiflorum]KAK1609998.1 hypothetical protein QYE76_033671 [Lolium multiflorum]